MNKAQINQTCRALLIDKIEALAKEMQLLQADANLDTKSSAGDKFETARSMAQLEIEKLRARKKQTEEDLAILVKLATENQEREWVSVGALINTNYGWFYVSVSLGKIVIPEGVIFVISPQSPLAIALNGKKLGETAVFNKIKYQIIGLE